MWVPAVLFLGLILTSVPSAVALMLFVRSHRDLFGRRKTPVPERWNLELGRVLLMSALSPLIVAGSAEVSGLVQSLAVTAVGLATALAIWFLIQPESSYNMTFVPPSLSRKRVAKRSKKDVFLIVGIFQICLGGLVAVAARIRQR